MNRVLKEAERLLSATGRTWRTENGGSHHKLFLGEVFVGVVSRGACKNHDCDKIASKIRRIMRHGR